MRLLFINSIQMFGGGEIWLLTMMRQLKKRGHTVHLLCRPKVPLEDKASEQGFSVHTIGMRGDFDPIVIWRTWRLLRRLKIQVVCTNMDKELRFGGLAAKLAGVKAVIPRRGIDYPLKNSWAYRFSYDKMASGIIANSQSTKKSLLRNCPWLNPDKIRVIYNGVDPNRFVTVASPLTRSRFDIKKNIFLIGFVGQLDPRKGVDTLIRSYTRFSLDHKESTLLLVGEGGMENSYRKMSETCPGRIVFAGYLDEIDDVMKSIDVLVLPSLWEGFGIVLIEAMAAGKPVITTTASNMPEIVTDGTEGFLIQPGDDKALTLKLAKLYQDPKLRKKMGEWGRKRVLKQFTLERMVSETDSIFSQFTAR